MERTAAGRDMSHVHERLQEMFREQTAVPRKLRALWTLWVTEGVDQSFLLDLLHHPNEYLRAWGVRLLGEDGEPTTAVLEELQRLAVADDSPLVRLHLASVLQRFPPSQRWAIVQALAARGEDAADASLPLMLWYATEPLMHDDLTRFVQLSGHSQIPKLREFMSRRVMDQRDVDPGARLLVQQLETVEDGRIQSDLLRGMLRGLEGRRTIAQPASWPVCYQRLSVSPNQEVRDQAMRLALIFDDPVALRQLRDRAADDQLPAAERIRAIDALVGRRPPALASLLLGLVADGNVRRAALRGLAYYDDPATFPTIVSAYDTMDPVARQQALQTLASRRDWARQLMDVLESQQISPRDVTAYTARQIQSLGDAELTRRLREVWGDIRTTDADRRQRIERYRRQLTATVISHADLVHGRAVFEKQCATCHRFFELGGSIGPDLTGAQRTNLDYLLENILDPSAMVARDYRMQVLELTDGRVMTGLVEAENDQAVTLLTVSERLVVPVAEIEERHESDVSMMPDGLLNPLTPAEIRDLIGFLQGSH